MMKVAIMDLTTVGTILAKGSNVGAGGACIRRGSMARYIVLRLVITARLILAPDRCAGTIVIG